MSGRREAGRRASQKERGCSKIATVTVQVGEAIVEVTDVDAVPATVTERR
jgi:hypothetical protein